MGTVPSLDEKRNQNLITDYCKQIRGKFKFSTTQLVVKYEISSTRIYEILDKYGVPRRVPKKLKKKK